jgi:hypothetical protein
MVTPVTVLCRAAPAALRRRPEERVWALHRAQLILTVPAVQEKAALRWLSRPGDDLTALHEELLRMLVPRFPEPDRP